MIPTVDDYRDVPLLEVRPPGRGPLLRPRQARRARALRRGEGAGRGGLSERDVEDEFVYQNSIALNNQFYASLGDKRAFVLSHARNLMILKIVGFAEAAVQYYRMPDTRAHVWIAHQRYPDQGPRLASRRRAPVHRAERGPGPQRRLRQLPLGVRVPGRQRNIFPQFLTDTEVSVLLFDLWNRVYQYPLEYIIEALAPTTELDFDRLPAEKQRIYRQIQATHIHASPDGPWFFIIARSLAETGEFQLLGITDTAMLRPQVFALQEGEVSIGLICSEKQAIDATLASLAGEDPRFTPVADLYWNARGGSYTDGGAFLLTVSPTARQRSTTETARDQQVRRAGLDRARPDPLQPFRSAGRAHADGRGHDGHRTVRARRGFRGALLPSPRTVARDGLRLASAGSSTSWADRTAAGAPALGIEALTLCIDRRYPTGEKKRSSVLTILRGGLEQIFERQPLCDDERTGTHVRDHLGHARPPARPAARRDDAADRRPRLPARGRRLRCGAGGQGLPARLAAPGPLQHAAARGSTASGFGPAPTACGSTATTTRATTSAPAWTAWRSTSTATPRTSSARSPSAASWSSTATWDRRSSTAPRAARSTCWATPPAGR